MALSTGNLDPGLEAELEGIETEGLLGGGWDDDEAYQGEMMDQYAGLLGGGSDFYDEDEGYQGQMMGQYAGLLGDDRGFYDDDEEYQGQMMNQYTKDFEGNYDARNIGQKIGGWLNKNSPIINLARSLGFDANLDQSLGTGNELDAEGNRRGESDRDDQVAENACAASGGTWDGGTCVMPSDDSGDDDDGGGIDYGAFGKPDPFASINRKRQMFYHPMMGGTAHGNVYSPYSGERPDYISESIWDYKPPRAGAEFNNWSKDLRNWASGS